MCFLLELKHLRRVYHSHHHVTFIQVGLLFWWYLLTVSSRTFRLKFGFVVVCSTSCCLQLKTNVKEHKPFSSLSENIQHLWTNKLLFRYSCLFWCKCSAHGVYYFLFVYRMFTPDTQQQFRHFCGLQKINLQLYLLKDSTLSLGHADR